MLKSTWLSLIVIGLALLSVGVLAQTPSHGVSMKVHDLKAHGVIILPPGDPQFEAEAAKILATSKGDWVQAVKDISVIIHNLSDKTIVGYSLRWEFKDSNGKITPKGVGYLQPSWLLDGGRAKHPPDLEGGTLIRPEGRRLVSTFATLGANSTSQGLSHPDIRRHIGYFAALMNESAEATVILDGVLFEDGTFAGPDQDHRLERFFQSFAVEQEFYRHLLGLAESGASESDIVAWVKTYIIANIGAASEIQFYLHVDAGEILNVRDKFGWPEALKVARSKFYKQPPQFTRIAQ